MRKILKLLLVNLLILFVLFIMSEISVYYFCVVKEYPKFSGLLSHISPFTYVFSKPYVHLKDLKYHFTGEDNVKFGRTPDGLEYNNEPIIIFGCSYAHGQFLEKNQTLSYKLSKILQRPIYNRAVWGQAFQEMYYQSTQDEFYNSVKPSDTVLYVVMNDEYRRIYLDFLNVWDTFMLLGYDEVDGHLKLRDYSNPFKNFFKSLYTVKFIKMKYTQFFLEDKNNVDIVADDVLLYFIKTREELEKHWNNKINFNVLFYGEDKYKDVLKIKLMQNGFNVGDTDEMTDENLYDAKYMQTSNWHPTEAAWDLLAPKIVHRFF